MVKEYTNGDETLFMYEQTDKTDRHGTGDVFFESYGSIIVSKKKVEQHFETSLSLSFSLFLFFFGGDSSSSSSSLWFGVFPFSFLASSSEEEEESLFDDCL